MIYRIFGFLFLLAALGLGVFAARDFIKPDPWASANPAKKIRMIVEKDAQSFTKEQNVPPEWAKISKTVYKFESSIAKVLMAAERPNFNSTQKIKALAKSKNPNEPAAANAHVNDEKEYELEVDVLDVPDETDPGFIFQMSLFESKSKNKIYEIGRTYHWSSLNEDHP